MYQSLSFVTVAILYQLQNIARCVARSLSCQFVQDKQAEGAVGRRYRTTPMADHCGSLSKRIMKYQGGSLCRACGSKCHYYLSEFFVKIHRLIHSRLPSWKR